MKRQVIFLAAIAVAAVASASPVVFPAAGTWEGVRYSPDGKSGRIVSPDGAAIATLQADGGTMADVKVSVNHEGLVIDAADAFAKGLRGVVLETPVLPELAAYAGKDVAFSMTIRGHAGMSCLGEVLGKVAGASGKWDEYIFNGRELRATLKRDNMRDFTTLNDLKEGTSDLRFRFTVEKQGGGPIELRTMRFGTVAELGVKTRFDYPPQKRLFHASFDGTADAESADGTTVMPLCAEGLSFAEGRHGQAVRISSKAGSRLEYPFAGHALPEQGTFSAWVKCEGNPMSQRPKCLFSFGPPPDEKTRLGSGQKRAMWLDGALRVDASDDSGRSRTETNARLDDKWHHVMVTWYPGGVGMMFDGVLPHRGGVSALSSSLTPVNPLSFSHLADFASLCIGGEGGGNSFEGLIDDVEVFAAPMTPAEARNHYFAQGGELPPQPDYAAIIDARGGNPYEADAPATVPGELKLEFVEEVRLDSEAPCERFRAVGDCAIRELAGRKYLEGGAGQDDRFAVGFTLDPSHPLYAFEIDYPDDAMRTMGILIQSAKGSWNDYRMQCGLMTGGELPNTGRMLTHRVLWWTCGGSEVAVILRNAAAEAGVRGAAAAAIRLYRVKDGRLPPAPVADAPAVDGWNRMFALYFEDPAVSLDFLHPFPKAWSPDRWCELMDKLAATMKFTGQNCFAYPAVWYNGMLGHESAYLIGTRPHPPYYRKAIYEKFDREGLFAIPTLNQHDLLDPPAITYESRIDGSLHASVVTIMSSGRPNGKGWHGSPPNWNFAHPDIQSLIEREFDILLDEGVPHPSFKGICLHLTPHSLHWFGLDEGGLSGGFNDYCIDAFEKAKGLKVPVDRNDPMRGKAYYEWIRDNASEAWVEWRCDVVSGFYLRIAEKMRQRRPDLKLWINMEWTLDSRFENFTSQDFFRRGNRAGGIDAERFRGSNVILSQTCVPSDIRWPGTLRMAPQDRAYLGRLWREPPFFDLMRGADYPAVNMHERYYESNVGARFPKGSPQALTCDWFSEHTWRVETINPAGRHVLSTFVGPLAVQDVLGFSKGGYLMGNYGSERELARFAQYFRALPAVPFTDVSAQGTVRVRRGSFKGRNYLYVANTGPEPTSAEVDFGGGMEDCATGERLKGRLKLDLPPWEFRSFKSILEKE